ncbi:Vacuolar protein sorting-associated protein 1 [Fusarium oxysporum f. sp. albedinis]|nr:Vacuolar protein sorting-associated protein 1 [Fusarium oxysporum f. sp. albedinis]
MSKILRTSDNNAWELHCMLCRSMFVTGSEGLITWYYLRGAHFRRLLRRPYLIIFSLFQLHFLSAIRTRTCDFLSHRHNYL